MSKSLGPNIPPWDIRYNHGDYVRHGPDCGGCIIQPVRRKGIQPIGKIRCLKCSKYMGKVARKMMSDRESRGSLAIELDEIIGKGFVLYFRYSPSTLKKEISLPYNPLRSTMEELALDRDTIDSIAQDLEKSKKRAKKIPKTNWN